MKTMIEPPFFGAAEPALIPHTAPVTTTSAAMPSSQRALRIYDLRSGNLRMRRGYNPLQAIAIPRAKFAGSDARMHLVPRVRVARDAAEDGDHRRRRVGVVREAVPLAGGDVHHLARLLPDGFALAQVEPRPFEEVEDLLGMRVAVNLVPAVRREDRRVEDDAL